MSLSENPALSATPARRHIEGQSVTRAQNSCVNPGDCTRPGPGFDCFNLAVLNSLPLEVAVLDAQGRIIAVNEPWLRFAAENGGPSQSSAGLSVGANYLDICRAASHDGVPEAVAALDGLFGVLTGREPEFRMEYECHAPDRQRWYEMHVRPFLETGGAVVTHLDITQRKLAEQSNLQSTARMREVTAESTRNLAALRDEQELLKTIIDRIPVMIAIYDPAGGRFRVNSEFERTLGWSSETAGGISILAECFPDPAYRKQAARFMRSNRERWLDIRMRTRDGRQIETTWANIRLSNRTRVSIGVDITERKRVEQELRESRARERAFLEHLPVGLWFANAEGRIVYANPAARDIWAGARYVGPEGFGEYRAWWHGTDRLIRAEDWAVARAVTKGETSLDELIDIECFDGTRKTILNSAVPVRDVNGVILGAVIINQDITEKQKAEAALRAAHEQLSNRAVHLESLVRQRTASLQETVAELEAFSYSIAHDMRAPLRAMQGFSTLLLAEYASGLAPSARGYLQRIATAARRMDALIIDILNYSRILRDDLPLKAIELQPFIREILASYPSFHSEHADIQIEGALPAVLANEAALTQVVSNLLGNAVKFVDPGVRPMVRLRAEWAGNQATLWFEDNGIGIPAEALSRLFQIFSRAHRPQLYEGTGIGLAIVRKAVERMGGSVGVESEPGRGSKFWVRLPIAAAPAETAPPEFAP